MIKKALPSLIAIIIGLLVGVFIITFTNLEVFQESIPKFLLGPFNRGLTGFGDLFYYALPLIMTGLSVAFAYQTGLFNIGASGQFLFGGFLAIVISHKLKSVLPNEIMWLFAMILAAFGGALMGSIVGALKAYRNVNEVITCIMLNYISMYTVNHLIKKWKVYNQLKNQTVDIKAAIPKLGIDKLFPGTIAGGGILIAILLVILLHILLNKTTFGFEVRGVGLNRHAAQYAGINENKAIILSMAISGGLAGIAGAMLYLSGAGTAISIVEVLPSEGFDGIAVALLGLSEPFGVLLSALFIAYVKMGGQAIQTLGFAPELTNMIIAFILYVSALSLFFRKILSKRSKKLPKEVNNG